MPIKNETYRQVGNKFEEFRKHVVSEKSLIEKPYRDDKDEVFYYGLWLDTLDDGMEVELCFWADLMGSHCDAWDVSINKKHFNEKGTGNFLEYLKSKGIFLESICDDTGKWHYGIIEKEDCYRIQYSKNTEEEDDA